MAFEVIPFCWIVKFSGITRFLYQFWKILPKYCCRKEKDHNILWSKWYSRREYFGLRPCADCVGANRRTSCGRSSPIEIPKFRPLRKQWAEFWYSRRESNPQRPLRRGLLYPFNYGSILNFIARGRNDCRKKFYTKIYTNIFPPREK